MFDYISFLLYPIKNAKIYVHFTIKKIKLQKRAARVGFDWPSYENVLDKIIEEARELADAAADGNSAHTEEEFGDLLFTFVNLGRHLNIDAEIALKKTNNKESVPRLRRQPALLFYL